MKAPIRSPSTGSPAGSRSSSEGGPFAAGEGGFTLLEILVALVVLGLALGIYLQVFSAGIGNTRIAQAQSTAVMLAESKLAALGVEEPLVAGETQGSFGDRFRWRAVVAPFPAEGAPQDAGRRMELYVVEVTVTWISIDGERSLSLASLRLASIEDR